MKIHEMKVKGEHYGWLLGCPGCGGIHQYDNARWPLLGTVDAPTFQPSYLARGVNEGAKYVCHSYVTSGSIHFLSDCTHELARKTVEIPEWNHPDWDDRE